MSGDRAAAFEQALSLRSRRAQALIVVNMQRAFLEPGEATEVPAAREIIPRIQHVLAVSRRPGLPVVFTQFVYAETP